MLSVASTATVTVPAFWLKWSFDEALDGFLQFYMMLTAAFSFNTADCLISIKLQAIIIS
jgi:hypothetical protein